MATLRSTPALDDVVAGMRFFLGVPELLRTSVTSQGARDIMRARLQTRESNFLTLAHTAIYGYPNSPYRYLLDLAGCEYGDLERLVGQDGVEGALGQLYRRGVYLTVDEAKGRRPVVRGTSSFVVQPATLRNPMEVARVAAASGGSRGPSAPASVGLDHMHDVVMDMRAILDARGGLAWEHAFWGVPGASAIRVILRYAGAGAHVARWFTMVDPSAPGLHSRYAWSGRALRWGARLAGRSLPRPENVAPSDPLPIARWMSDVLRHGRTPSLHTYASAAARVCQAAQAAGLDLHGAQFYVGGEPITAARMEMIHRVGGHVSCHYATVEAGGIGEGCQAPEAPDDMHIRRERVAVIQPVTDGATTDLPVRALLVTSLELHPIMILLNLSTGDQAELDSRACGCALQDLGWTQHLHSVRSYEKLTAGGMTFLDADLIHLLEQELPARFGGSAMDYQLVETEDEAGIPRLHLLVHPRLGPLDEDAVREAFLTAIGRGSGVERVMALTWSDAHVLAIDREAPRATGAGKVLHLHVERVAAPR